MKNQTTVGTVAYFRSIVLPGILLFGALHFYPFFFPASHWTTVTKIIVLEACGIWIMMLLAILRVAREKEAMEFVSEHYHSKVFLISIGIFLRALEFLTMLLTLLRRPVGIFMLILPFTIWIKPESLDRWLDPYGTLAVGFISFSLVCQFFLTEREESFFDSTEKSFENIKGKTIAFKNWVFRIDIKSEDKLELRFFPKDAFPSVLFLLFHWGKTLGTLLLSKIIRFLNKYGLRKTLIIFLPFVAIGEFIYYILNLLNLLVYLGVSYSLRVAFRLIYFAGYLGALAYNIYSLVETIRSRSPHQLIVGLVTTIGAFLCLEVIRHLNMDLPIREKTPHLRQNVPQKTQH